jgi:uncharacterized membrane protein (GlpM family)
MIQRTTTATDDPVLATRARIALAVKWAKIVGYGLYLVAIIGFVVLRINKPSTLLSSVIIWSLAIGSLFLAPAIVFGYAVKAAEREDRERAAVTSRSKTDAK